MMSQKTTTLSQTTRPWDRLPGEGIKPYAAFREYMRHRRIQAVADLVGSKNVTIRNYSSKFNWAGRLEAWEQEKNKVEEEAVLDERKSLAREHLKSWRRVGEIAMMYLNELLDDNDEVVGHVKPRDIITMLDRATHYERLVLGDVTDRQEVKSDIDMSKLSTEELIELKRIRSKASTQ